MTVLAPAFLAARGGDQPSGHLRQDSLWDRRVVLLDGESAAWPRWVRSGCDAIGRWVSHDERHDAGMRWPG